MIVDETVNYTRVMQPMLSVRAVGSDAEWQQMMVVPSMKRPYVKTADEWR